MTGGSPSAGRRDRIYGLVFLAIGLAALYGSARLGIGDPASPEPGFFPFAAAAVFTALSVVVVVQCLRGHGYEGEAFGQVRAPIFVIGGLVLFVATLDLLGYILATALLAAIILAVFGIRRPLLFAIAVPLVAGGSYLLFHSLLGLPLPGGLLG